MGPLRPGDDPRILLVRSVTYVRALFPWELCNVRGANDDHLGPTPRREDGAIRPTDSRGPPASRPEV